MNIKVPKTDIDLQVDSDIFRFRKYLNSKDKFEIKQRFDFKTIFGYEVVLHPQTEPCIMPYEIKGVRNCETIVRCMI